jgi:hypothetical protein
MSALIVVPALMYVQLKPYTQLNSIIK